MKRKILVATTNPGKIAEIRAMLEFDVEWVGLSDFPNINEIKEDGETFSENARKLGHPDAAENVAAIICKLVGCGEAAA